MPAIRCLKPGHRRCKWVKIINDAFGHAYGDKLLIKIADILKSCFRKEDIIARWGGDEFSILLPNTSYSTTMQIVNRVIKNVRNAVQILW